MKAYTKNILYLTGIVFLIGFMFVWYFLPISPTFNVPVINGGGQVIGHTTLWDRGSDLIPQTIGFLKGEWRPA